MKTVGVLFCGYNTEETIHESLAPWIAARENKLGGYEFVISAVSVPFAEYKNFHIIPDKTTEILQVYRRESKIDALTVGPQYISEAESRNLALQHLLDAECDLVCLVDADELFTETEISNILNFIKLDKWTTWFSFSFKNYVFTDKTYLIEPFQPPRAFRCKSNGYLLDKMSYDNDVLYRGTITRDFKDYRGLPSKIIPPSVAWTRHLTWMNNEKSKNKVAYQKIHFGGVCSYDWDDARGGLIFNENYYRTMGKSLPEIAHDE